MTQLSLFGDEPELDDSGLPPIPDPPADLVALAGELPDALRLGTCSWTFPGWDLVYRRRYPSDRVFAAECLAEYAAFPLFRAVEIDSSYYNPLGAAKLREYAERLPPEFECPMKVWSEITTFVFPRHPRYKDRAGMRNPHFLDPRVFADLVIAPIAEAGFSQLGPLLLCVPPIPRGALDGRLFEQRLSRFLAQAPEGYRYAVELRDPDLFGERHLALLADHGAAHVFTYHGRMPSLAEQLELAGLSAARFAFCRLMLPPDTRYEEQKRRFEPFDKLRDPQPEMRAQVARLVAAAAAAPMPIYVSINNKVEGSSPLTAIALATEIAAAGIG
jgi:uncharacterized protein YecE (DUF72 family)